MKDHDCFVTIVRQGKVLCSVMQTGKDAAIFSIVVKCLFFSKKRRPKFPDPPKMLVHFIQFLQLKNDIALPHFFQPTPLINSLSELMELWLETFVSNFLGSSALIPILPISIKL